MDDGFRTVYSSHPLFEHDDSYDEISIHNIMTTNSSIRINNNLELDVVFMGLIKKNKLRYSM